MSDNPDDLFAALASLMPEDSGYMFENTPNGGILSTDSAYGLASFTPSQPSRVMAFTAADAADGSPANGSSAGNLLRWDATHSTAEAPAGYALSEGATILAQMSPTSLVAKFDASGRPICPFNNCGGHSWNLGGSTRGTKYAFMCEVCGKRWHQLREPDMLGSYMVAESKRSVGNERRRSDGYACGKCGFRPKAGHICPYKNIDIQETLIQRVGPPLPTINETEAETTAKQALVDAQELLSMSSSMQMSSASTGASTSSSSAILPAAPSSFTSQFEDDRLDAAEALTADYPFCPSGDAEDAADDDANVDSDKTQSLENSTLKNTQKMESIHGHAVHKILALVRHKVKGDGSCWVYAILAAAGLCEHTDIRLDNDPTPLDRARDVLCRIMSNAWLTRNGATLQLTAAEIASLDDILKVPKYPLKEEDDFGTFGNNTSIAGLCGYLKVTIVLWNKKTLRNPRALQQVVCYSNGESDSIKEHHWSTKKILEYSLSNETIHIEWNGTNHYAALIPSTPVAIDAGVHWMLSNAAPIDPPPDAIPSEQSRKRKGKALEWHHIQGGIRVDALQVYETGYKVPSTRREIEKLKEECVRDGFTGILLLTDAVKFVRYDFPVTKNDCAQPGDFSCSMYVLKNSDQYIREPPLFNCTCNIFLRKKQSLIQCDMCGRWCHLTCTPYARLPLSKLADIRHVCVECVASSASN